MPNAAAIQLRPHEQLTPAERAELINLCTRAYEEDFAPYFGYYAEATHVVARDAAGRALSHALWLPRPLWAGSRALRTAYVEAVATEPGAQGRGYASAVLRALAEAVAAEDYELGALAPSDPAFYARLGWESWRGPRLVRLPGGQVQPTPDEDVMVLRLPRTPPGLDLAGPLTAPWRDGDIW